MPNYTLIIVLSLVWGFSLLPNGQDEPAVSGVAMQEITPAVRREALDNPGIGIYLYGTLDPGDMPADAWYRDIIRIGYFRDDWSVLEPEEDKYRFEEYFSPIFDLWVKQWGKRVAFRFMAENMHSRQRYVTPKWVFDKGVPSVKLKGLYVDEQIDPVFWDERYLAIQEKFIADLGRYLDGRPGLEFIDIGSIGEWGEMHLARWTPEMLRQAGFTPARYIAAYRRLIDAFARAFPRTRVFLNVGDYEAINDYAALRGLHFRQDGLNPSGPSADVGKRFFHPYARRGVVCNYELHSGYEEMKQKGWGVRETFEKGLEDPISYLHINLMSYRSLQDPPAEVKESVIEAARRIGYRFTLTKLRCNRTLRLDGKIPGRLLIGHTWINEGIAPCYASYALRWTLADEQGRTVAELLDFPARPTTLWFPGEEISLKTVLPVPPQTQPGTCRLKVAMVEPENPAVRIQLGMAGRDTEGRYDLCPVPAEKRPAVQAAVYREGFEQGTSGWDGTEGIDIRTDAACHTGKAGLRVAGLQPGTAWNYAQINLPGPVLPGSRYRLSCWMKMENIPEGAAAPYLKIGLTDGKNRWLTNINTGPYDTARMGEWQQLIAYVETTPDTEGGHLAVEKGSLEARSRILLWLDDVELELMESP